MKKIYFSNYSILQWRTLFIVPVLIILLGSCTKSVNQPGLANENAGMNTAGKPKNQPPPKPFYFNNCSNPGFSGNFSAGAPASVSFTLNYINSPGGSYPAFTSSSVNGLTVTAPGGTLTNGSGSIAFTASGTPLHPGNYTIPISIGGSIPCQLSVTVLNMPPDPTTCSEPASTPGSIGCISFTYRGQQVTYYTVRAADGKVWILHNLGSPQVALNGNDQGSFGHYFQWGRWDDGHQLPNGPSLTGSSLLQNPSHISSGNPNFIKGSTISTSWWGIGANASDTWSGTTATATNGKDPCVVIGAGWRLPTAAEWQNVINLESISDATSAFQSNLKLTESGYRASSSGGYIPHTVGGYYWSSTAGNNNMGTVLFFDNAYNAFISPSERGYGFNCRCIKN